MNGGYDDGYKSCPCFWGRDPGSLVLQLSSFFDFRDKRVLDAGCGEGKNAAFAAELGAIVDAIDMSPIALQNGQRAFEHASSIRWTEADVSTWYAAEQSYDLVIAYGLLHCLQTRKSIESLIERLRRFTRSDGYHVVCAFNDRCQDLSAHPNFKPTLIPHADYLDFYNKDKVVTESDSDLSETHPHNNIQHSHSLTRMIVQVRHDG